MKNFLMNPDSAFYHITPISNWESIQLNGLNSIDKRIFVCCVSDFSVLFAVAIEQLPEIYKSDGFIIIRLPQSSNNFQSNEIRPDGQALVEWTKPFQQIILREHIPFNNLEIYTLFQYKSSSLREAVINQMTLIANNGQVKYANHQMRNWAEGIVYT